MIVMGIFRSEMQMLNAYKKKIRTTISRYRSITGKDLPLRLLARKSRYNLISIKFFCNSNKEIQIQVFSSPQGSQRRDCRQVVLIRQAAVVQDQDFQTVDLLQRTQIKINSGETEIYCSQLRRDLKTDNKSKSLG